MVAETPDQTTSSKRVMVIYGTRPEAVKVAPLIMKLGEDPRFNTTVVVTGQHRSMLDQVNSVFGISPDVDVDLFATGQSLNSLTSKIFDSLDSVLESRDPDAVVVQGDTTTVMAAAIASFYRSIPVVHLEAGLRSHDISSPFPEEANRKIVSQISALNLAPTAISRQNLVREGINPESIFVTGNTVVDALEYAITKEPSWSDPRIEDAIQGKRKILLVTAHRRENWGDAMVGVGKALGELAQRWPELLIVLPAHKNPIVREAILPQLTGLSNVLTTEPLPYLEFARLLERSDIVLTDSGGIQEEAPSLGKPVLVLRENTERPEAVEAGTVKLVGTQQEDIVSSVSRLLSNEAAYNEMAQAVNPYGDGEAAERSVSAIAELLGVGARSSEFQP